MATKKPQKVRGVLDNAARRRPSNTTTKRPKAPGAGVKTLLFCPGVATVVLPWWPDEVERANIGRDWEQFARPGRRPLLTSPTRRLDTYQIGYTLRSVNYGASMAQDVDAVQSIADSEIPVALVMASTSRGLFQVTDCSIVELEHSASGEPSVVDVSLTLTRASDATVWVGPVARKRNKIPKAMRGETYTARNMVRA